MSDLFIHREKAEADLLAAAAYLAERIKSSDGHAEAMSAVLPLYLDRGDVDLAAELANAINDPHSRDKLLTKVAEKCAQTNDDEYAIQLADAIEDLGLRSEAFERIGAVKAGQGNAATAFEIADLMNHPDFIYAAVAFNQASNGNDAGADETLGRIEFSPAMSSALQNIADVQIEKGELEKAVQSLERGVIAAEEIEHDEERIRTLCEFGNHFIAAGRKDLAIETFEKARSYAEVVVNVHRDRLLVMCSVGFLHAGSDDAADEILDLVLDKTQLASALLVFARDSWKKEEKEEAVDTLEEAYAIIDSQKESETRDSRARNAILASIAAQFAVFERNDRATEIAQNIVDPQEIWAAISQIAQVLSLQKKDDLARDTINLIDDDTSKVSALIAVSDIKLREGESDEALALLDESSTLAETIPQLVARSNVFIEIASRYAAQDLLERVRAIGIENLDTIGAIRDESSQATALANLSEVYKKAGLSLTEGEKDLITRMIMKH